MASCPLLRAGKDLLCDASETNPATWVAAMALLAEALLRCYSAARHVKAIHGLYGFGVRRVLMRRLIEVSWKFIFFLRREQLNHDVEGMTDDSVLMKTKDLGKGRMSSDEVRNAAKHDSGKTLILRKTSRDPECSHWLEAPFQDIQHGFRQLRRNPGFTAAAIITLALGIGANTAIFSVVDAILIRPLPFRESSRLVDIFFSNRRLPVSGKNFTPENLTEIESQGQHLFSGVVRRNLAPLSWTVNGRSTVMTCGTVSQGFFGLLGIVPEQGRFFVPEDFRPGRGDVVVLSHQLWVSAYDTSPNVVGQTITLNGIPRLVVGVAPPGLQFLEGRFQGSVGAWIPVSAPGATETYALLARLKPSVSLSEVRAGLETIAARLALKDPADYKGWAFTVMPVHELLTGDVRPALLLLLGATALVLLIAIVNVANLLLVRGWQRAKGVAVQIALGATRRRVIAQWAIESTMLGLFGGLAGLLLALLGMRLFNELASPNLLRMPAAHLNGAVIALCGGVALLAGILIGVVPAIQISRLDPNAVLHSGDVSGGRGESREVRKAMSGLMVVEIALALTVTASSMLLIRSFASLTHTNTGMRMSNLLTMRISVPPETYARYSKPKQWTPFVQNLLAHVRSAPGVESAAASDLPVLIGLPNINSPVKVGGVTMNRVGHRMVTPGYFRTLGIPVLAGRTFNENTIAAATGSVVINQAFAKLMWKGRNPIGQQFDVMAGDHPLMMQVIGVVGNTRNQSLASTPEPTFYAPFYQWPFHHLALFVHTAVDPASLAPTVERQVWVANQSLAIWQVRTIKQLIAENETGSRSRALLLGIFAFLGLTLAVLGVYGVFSYAVTRRTHEFAIRMALGARRGDIWRMVLLEGARLAALGVTAGFAGMFLFAHMVRSLLYGVSVNDPATLAATASLISVTSLLACYLPARRASGADPASALRYE